MGQNSFEQTADWLNLPPTRAQRRAALAVSIGVFLALAGLSPFFQIPLSALNAVFPALDAIVFVSSAVTATLLFAQFSISGSRRLFILANGYLFCALIVIPHALTITGAFSPTGLLGANAQTGSWLYIFWHFGLAISLLLYALVPGESDVKFAATAFAAKAIVSSIVALSIVVCGLTWLSTAGAALLPAIIVDNRISSAVVYPIALTITVFAAVIAVLWIRGRCALVDQWIMVLAWVSILELAVSGLVPTIRFSLGFYAGRVLSLITTNLILIILLAETTALYARLVRSNLLLRRERDNKLMSLEAVASAINHEIRQPLGTIVMNGESATIYLEKKSADVDTARSMLQKILIDAHRIGDTLQSIRGIFGKDDQERAPVGINDLVLEALPIFKSQLSECNIVVQLQLTSELTPVSGHRGQLRQVIDNLVQNAIDAMRDNGISQRVLTVRTAPVSATEIMIEVEDSGIGIAPAELGKIFDAFVSTKPGGMGLGLAICQTIVARHDGSISVTAAHPRGSVFRVTLPGLA